ncbi:50S ribosomal protein L35 [Candidatus Karelsulcia muelleri]|uniref:Large ribosomal subunit protein bL35 n=1 Tax=Candidatus Karelsulcia muelleri TaxID=336810 RepID=A0A346E0S2_9FLAO|nr:50S ribosomal protein L35 [Candidatus Karelsulcia muelleri]AXN02577.1 LSU ribosomal protein L35p [Candidatus Karelsulcia muelleri]WDE42188.1 50S ribosomal protein L35 [Candidatus Karelsulcia muelleri]WDI79518.1 50S ribosomal protein L35 [Candidatus Karelsulcia muelleri]WDR78975.1 50S ribosomal protein L35 [Candidatus Karelsulcia muelleri]WDR79035.1 50S ribosomal protein L35 [Candidatus Karelsulcia muelleri]
MKLKRKSSYKKRFKITSNGFIKRKKAFKNHILTKKSKKRKRRLSNFSIIKNSIKRSIKKNLFL